MPAKKEHDTDLPHVSTGARENENLTNPANEDKIDLGHLDPELADKNRTGPNVDIGLEAGQVTVDPNTAQGLAAAAARKKHNAGAVEVEHEPTSGQLKGGSPAN